MEKETIVFRGRFCCQNDLMPITRSFEDCLDMICRLLSVVSAFHLNRVQSIKTAITSPPYKSSPIGPYGGQSLLLPILKLVAHFQERLSSNNPHHMKVIEIIAKRHNLDPWLDPSFFCQLNTHTPINIVQDNIDDSKPVVMAFYTRNIFVDPGLTSFYRFFSKVSSEFKISSSVIF